MILSFTLSMPGCPSWNGRWSGDGTLYAITKTFRGNDVARAQQIFSGGPYSYRWSDGWRAEIAVAVVSSAQAAKLRKQSKGFHGYEWMVDTICKYGRPLAEHEVKALQAAEVANAQQS